VFHRPILMGRDPSIPQFWDLLKRPHSMRNDNQILHGDQTEKKFYRVDYVRMLTRDLFAVANRLVVIHVPRVQLHTTELRRLRIHICLGSGLLRS